MRKVYDINTPINYFRPEATPERLLAAIKNLNPKSPLGTQSVMQAFYDAGKRWNVDQVYLLAHAILESAWGTSRIARDKNILFGYKAYARHHYNSTATFDSFEACIFFLAEFVSTQYLNPNGKWYGGSATLAGMNVRYATATHWGKSIATLANRVENAMPTETGQEAEEKPEITAHSRNVIVAAEKGLNARTDPDTKSPVAKVFPVNTTVPVEGYTQGESVSGNNLWWKIRNVDLYIWSGGTNITPKVNEPNGVAEDAADLASLDRTQLFEKAQELVQNVEEFKAQRDVAIKRAEDAEKKNENLRAEVIKLSEDLTNYKTTKELNETLSTDIETYKTKNTQLKSDVKEAYYKAFEGWELHQIPAGVKGLATLPIVAVRLWFLVKSIVSTDVVVGWKKGAKIYAVELDE